MATPLVILAAIFGGAAAAFVPRIGYRLAVPYGSPPRSGCAKCGERFPPGRDGWLHAGGACGCRGGRLRAGGVGGSWGAVRVVPVGAAAAGLLAAALGPVPRLPVLLVGAVLGLLLAVIDLRCLRLPDPLVAALAATTGVAPAVLEPARAGVALAAAAVVGTGYLAIALLPGRGLGLGDVKLGAALALVLGSGGWPAVAVGLGAAHLINGVIAAGLLTTGRARGGRALPFGPALLTGALIGLTTV